MTLRLLSSGWQLWALHSTKRNLRNNPHLKNPCLPLVPPKYLPSHSLPALKAKPHFLCLVISIVLR